MQQDEASFIPHSEASTGAALPRSIKDDFKAFLEFGILAYSFLGWRRSECVHEKPQDFSCKRQGFGALRCSTPGSPSKAVV